MSIVIKGVDMPKNCHECPFLYVTAVCDGSKDCPIEAESHGKWIDAFIAADNLYDRWGMLSQMRGYVCNCCQDFSVARYKYCPNCGTKMDTEE